MRTRSRRRDDLQAKSEPQSEMYSKTDYQSSYDMTTFPKQQGATHKSTHMHTNGQTTIGATEAIALLSLEYLREQESHARLSAQRLAHHVDQEHATDLPALH